MYNITSWYKSNKTNWHNHVAYNAHSKFPIHLKKDFRNSHCIEVLRDQNKRLSPNRTWHSVQPRGLCAIPNKAAIDDDVVCTLQLKMKPESHQCSCILHQCSLSSFPYKVHICNFPTIGKQLLQLQVNKSWHQRLIKMIQWWTYSSEERHHTTNYEQKNTGIWRCATRQWGTHYYCKQSPWIS